ncbi:MAG: hypothetical protein MRZ65_00645 [Lachnospiraceae bacterium]|nr:hypothetical protein [Lachnospiraceae bacterium]
MLTITAPIELKCKAPENSMHEGFYHRIADQYSMMSINLTPEDLLHVMTTPPQYYFGGGDEMNIFQQTNVNAREENKLEVINNLVNRILVNGSAELTYQDRVYITDVMQKIGIKNVSEFMQQVRNIKQEQNNTNRLIDLYWNHAGEIRQLVENYKTEQNDAHITEELTEQKEILHLHEDILNRLQTAAVYQTMQNFNSRTQGDWNITNTELSISEQYRMAQNILLQKLKSEARGEKTPLIYRHENYYEQQQLTEERLNEQNILSQISSAVLLDLVENVYQSRSEQNMRGGDTWYHMEEAFYQNAQNTMQRIEQRMTADYREEKLQQNTFRTVYNQAQNNEIELLNRLFEDSSQQQYQTVNEMLYQDSTRQELINRISEQTDEQYLEQLLQEEFPQYYADHSSQIVNRLLDRKVIHQDTRENRILRQTIEQQNRLSQTNISEENKSQIDYNNTAEGDVNLGDVIQEQMTQVDQRNLTNIEQELSRINRENINNQSKYIQMMEGIRESMERPRERKSPEQMRRESLMALEHPTELLEQLHEEGQRQQLEKEEKLTQVMKFLPEQTREVYETVREYLAAPMELRREMTGVSDDMGMLIRDIHEAEVVREQTELVHKQQEQLHEQTREVIDRWKEQTPVEPQSKQVYEDRRTDVTLVHRSQEQQVDEELIQQMLEQNRTLSNTVRTQSETITNYDKTERTYNSVNTQQVIEQQEDVTELVRQGVQRELGALSEKIYHKLEKRLETEKRRRGY